MKKWIRTNLAVLLLTVLLLTVLLLSVTVITAYIGLGKTPSTRRHPRQLHLRRPAWRGSGILSSLLFN